MIQRRAHSTGKANDNKATLSDRNGKASEVHDDHEHDNASHTHSRSLFGHSHSNGEEHSHTHGTEQIVAAFQGQGDRGSRITLIGLVANVGLTAAKGLAGWLLHSASLLADAGHSLSDLLGDFVTLFCWRLSRKPPSDKYPYGFAKIETVGTSIVSLLLVGGALGIGFHSYHLLIAALGQSATTLPAGPLQEILTVITSVAPTPPVVGHGHVHAVDPNAAWFAATSVVAKEWLYRITKVVADEEKSPVLLANAIHHRSDAYSSLVALFAILGTWYFPALPLDPIGGLLVSFVILRQGLQLLSGAWGDLTDAGVPPRTRWSIERTLKPLLPPSQPATPLRGIENLRARRSGSLMFVDLIAIVPGIMSVSDASALEKKITRTLKEARKEIAEVRVKFQPSDHENEKGST
ncbi:putative dimerisation domain of Zinc Transporter [Lyophyllum shimeji]|uniref:Dimerisation domain of Zinc Transporter n=1 Tax=Lyophyllum shimeji TaxID=47721 RepID=A0A9P3PKC9_LYOSH|nr:putative dimerisation domain of Zinc Transporter [Lyophyllum shimeji]